jgi:hypothetical protein
MHITLSPVRMDAELSVCVEADALIVNGAHHDFADLAEGATRDPGEAWFAGPVCRQDGVIRLTLILPHDANAPEETRFPAPIADPPDGPLILPPAAMADPE